jgi:hypothetical protein
MAFKAKKSKAVESSTPASWSVAQFSSFYTQNRSELIAHANRIVKDKAKGEDYEQGRLAKALHLPFRFNPYKRLMHTSQVLYNLSSSFRSSRWWASAY